MPSVRSTALEAPETDERPEEMVPPIALASGAGRPGRLGAAGEVGCEPRAAIDRPVCPTNGFDPAGVTPCANGAGIETEANRDREPLRELADTVARAGVNAGARCGRLAPVSCAVARGAAPVVTDGSLAGRMAAWWKFTMRLPDVASVWMPPVVRRAIGKLF